MDIIGLLGETNILTLLEESLSLNASGLDKISPEVVSRLTGLITVLQAAGIIFIIYVVLLIIRWILSIKRTIELDKIHDEVQKINRKIDRLLRINNTKNIKKKGFIKK
jgi:hypothetical protein